MSYPVNHDHLHVEIQTPKQDSVKLEADLATFTDKYVACMEAGYTASITDNPMGLLSFQATDIIPELDLPVRPGQLLIHLNTFHTRKDLDVILDTAAEREYTDLLVISGDGSERLPRLSPDSLGLSGNAVTSVELLQYIHREYPGRFTCGVAFNPYEPQDHEIEKMRRKVDAGAQFIITQPIIGSCEPVQNLRTFQMPVIVDAWMSKKLHLLSQCVGYDIPENTPYDPIENLRDLVRIYPDYGLYLALLGFKTQFPILKDVLSAAYAQGGSIDIQNH